MARSRHNTTSRLSGTIDLEPQRERQSHAPLRRDLPLRKKFAFAATMALGIVLALELALWASGVQPAYLRRDPYAGFTPQVSHFQVETSAAGDAVVTVVPKQARGAEQPDASRGTSSQVPTGSSASGDRRRTADRSTTSPRSLAGSGRYCPRPTHPGNGRSSTPERSATPATESKG